MRGIKIKFKDGTDDEINPCDEIIIDNGYHQYTFKVDDIEALEAYEVEEEPSDEVR